MSVHVESMGDRKETDENDLATIDYMNIQNPDRFSACSFQLANEDGSNATILIGTSYKGQLGYRAKLGVEAGSSVFRGHRHHLRGLTVLACSVPLFPPPPSSQAPLAIAGASK